MTPTYPPTVRKVRYPESDGLPMSDNTLQFKWIVTLQGNIDGMFADDPNIFVAGNLLWYPIEGDNKTRNAPDVFVAFGRPKGERGSYRQWEEGGIAPQVAFEVLSPGNRIADLAAKMAFNEKYGIEEYYIWDPGHNTLEGFLRKDGKFAAIAEMDGWVSPRLGIRFDVSCEEMVVWKPDGERFLTYLELLASRQEQARIAEEQSRRAEEERMARLQAQQRADKADERANKAEEQARLLSQKLRELGIDPESM